MRNSLPLNGVTSMPFHPGCHCPFHRSVCLRSLLLLSQDCVLSSFGSVSFASAIPDLCFSISSLQPSSLTGPSPCLYTAGAYCFMWKERDSNPRCPTLFRRLSEALSIQRLFQCCLRPLGHPSLILCLAIPSQGHAALISAASYRHTHHLRCSALF